MFPDETVPHWFSWTSNEVDIDPEPAFNYKINKVYSNQEQGRSKNSTRHNLMMAILLTTYLKVDTVRIRIMSFGKYNTKEWSIKINIDSNMSFFTLDLNIVNFWHICR